MNEGRWWRWAALALIALLAGLFAAFNAGERVALNLGFTMLYRIPLVPLIFVVFLAGMTTMFLVGIRQDMRVRQALRDAGFAERARERDRDRPAGARSENTTPVTQERHLPAAPAESNPRATVIDDPDEPTVDGRERYEGALTEIPADGTDGEIPPPPVRPPDPDPPRDPP